MKKALNVQKETEKLREEVMHLFRLTLPGREFSTRMLLALIRLHMITKQIETSQELEERRDHLKEFLRVKRVIEYWVKALKQTMMVRKENFKKSA